VTTNFSGRNLSDREASCNAPTGSRLLKCWSCGLYGHVRRDCLLKPPSRETGKRPAGARPPVGSLNALRKIVATPPCPLLWVGLELKAGKVPALLDTDAQFSCMRSDVLRYLNQRREDFTHLPCSLTCLLGDAKKVQVENAVRLRVRLLEFSWGYVFKVLDEVPFPAILGLDFLRHKLMGWIYVLRPIAFDVIVVLWYSFPTRN
jgi:hypothetical protein